MVEERGDGPPLSRVESLLSCTPVELAGSARRLLSLGERVLATLPDVDQLTTLVVHIGPGSSLAELAATLAAARPSGIAVIGSADGTHAVALALHDGLVFGATGVGPWQTLGEWSLEFRRRLLGSRVATSGRQFDPARTFVTESVLAALARCDEPGASFALVSGELQWLDDRLDEELAPSLGHLLLEHARRTDEGPRIAAKVGAIDQMVVPLDPPGERAAKPTQKLRLEDENESGAERPGDESGWDFFDDPDPAAEAEWQDARRVFELCDGITDIAELVERSMLGRFRTLAALLALVERSHIVFGAACKGDPAEPSEDDAKAYDDLSANDLLDSLDDVG